MVFNLGLLRCRDCLGDCLGDCLRLSCFGAEACSWASQAVATEGLGQLTVGLGKSDGIKKFEKTLCRVP